MKLNKSKGFAFLTKGIKDAEIPIFSNLMSTRMKMPSHLYTNKSKTFDMPTTRETDMFTIGKTDVIVSTDMHKMKIKLHGTIQPRFRRKAYH